MAGSFGSLLEGVKKFVSGDYIDIRIVPSLSRDIEEAVMDIASRIRARREESL